MSTPSHNPPLTYLVRHGETAWTITRQHTGITDLPLTPRGELNARQLGQRLKNQTFTRVWTSPLQRAANTCKLAGFGAVASIDPDLVEWNYGDYEGKTTDEIRRHRPGWDLFRDGSPNGESISDVAARARRVIDRVRSTDGHTLLFSSSHFLRVLAACWLNLEPSAGRYFFLGTAAISIVGYEHYPVDPVIRMWNDCEGN